MQIGLLLLFLGCSVFNSEFHETANSEMGVADTILFHELAIQPGDSVVKNYYFYESSLYTGYAVDYQMAEDGQWRFIYSFENGIMLRLDVHGVKGYQHRFVEMKNGFEYHTVMYHRNGNRYLEQFYNQKKEPIGTWKRWYESGELEWEKSYD